MKTVLFAVALLTFTISAAAQKNDIGVLIGAHYPVDISISGLSIGQAFMVEGNYARQIADVPLIGIYAELPVVHSFNAGLSGAALNFGGGQLIRNYSSWFVVPGLKAKLAPDFPLSPYFVAGLGYAHFRSGSALSNGTPTPVQTSNHAAFDFGVGMDIKFLPLFGLRVEARDIFTGLPKISPLEGAASLLGLPNYQHNLLAGVGLTLRF